MIPPFLIGLVGRIGIKGGIALAFLLALSVQTARIEGFLWWDGFKAVIASLRAENGILRIDLDSIKLAQKIATEKAMEARRQADQLAAQQKEQSDARLEQALRDKRALAARYAAANRLRAKGAVAGSPGGTDLPCPATITESPDGACGDAELLALTKADFDILVTNTIRLQEAVTWAADQ